MVRQTNRRQFIVHHTTHIEKLYFKLRMNAREKVTLCQQIDKENLSILFEPSLKYSMESACDKSTQS